MKQSATLQQAIELLDGATMLAGAFRNPTIKVVRRDEAEAILRGALSAPSETPPTERPKWLVEFSENGEEYYGALAVYAHDLKRDEADEKAFVADGVRIEIDEHITEIREPT